MTTLSRRQFLRNTTLAVAASSLLAFGAHGALALMHRVHHSVITEETNSIYGFFLSIWDRICSTMIHAPEKGQDGVELGLTEWREPAQVSLPKLLVMPFWSKAKQSNSRL